MVEEVNMDRIASSSKRVIEEDFRIQSIDGRFYQHIGW